jgi:hypothetical protein
LESTSVGLPSASKNRLSARRSPFDSSVCVRVQTGQQAWQMLAEPFDEFGQTPPARAPAQLLY